MSVTFPCPNPTCAQTFSLEAVKKSPELVCPVCRTVFRFQVRPSAPPLPAPAARKTGKEARSARPPAPPSRKAYSDKPAAKPSRPPVPNVVPVSLPPRPSPPRPAAPPPLPGNVPLATPVGPGSGREAGTGASPPEPSSALAFGSEPGLLVAQPRYRARRREKSNKKRFLILGLWFLFGGGLATGIIFAVVWAFKGGDEFAPTAEQYNSQFRVPAGWQRDRNLELGMKVHLGLLHREPRMGMALAFKDFKTRAASKAELVDDALERLRSYFEAVEWEFKPEQPNHQLAGHPALVIEFQGQNPDRVIVNGECYMLSRQGYTYWFFTWGPLKEREQIRPQWQRLRDRLTFLNEREGWTEIPRETEPLRESRDTNLPYRLDYVKEVWEEVERAGYDPQADRVLLGNDPKVKRYAGLAATAQIIVIPGGGTFDEAVQAAEEHFLEGQKRLYPATTLAPVKDKSGAEIAGKQNIGNEPGFLEKVRVSNDAERQRYAVLAIIPRPQGTILIACECSWDRRDYWDLEFMPLIESYRTMRE
jgi:hypothetical protein